MSVLSAESTEKFPSCYPRSVEASTGSIVIFQNLHMQLPRDQQTCNSAGWIYASSEFWPLEGPSQRMLGTTHVWQPMKLGRPPSLCLSLLQVSQTLGCSTSSLGCLIFTTAMTLSMHFSTLLTFFFLSSVLLMLTRCCTGFALIPPVTKYYCG